MDTYSKRRTGVGVAALVVLGVVAGLFIAISGYSSSDAGEWTVIRNGGAFDNSNVRVVDGQPQVLPPGAGITWVGLASDASHGYPSTQRYFKVSAAPDADSNEVINVPSKDGVNLGVEGTFWFELNSDPRVLADLDNKFGTRTFPYLDRSDDPPTIRMLHAWEQNDAGWGAFLSGTLGGLVQNDLRQEIGQVNCPNLIATCVLAQPQAPNTDTAAVIAAAANTGGTTTITDIQDKVNKSFAKDVREVLGGDYFTNIKFVLAKVSLDPTIQAKINDAQGSYTDVTKAQAKKQTAILEADAQVERERGYSGCPTCARIDEKKALPPNLTTYVEAGSTAPVALGVR